MTVINPLKNWIFLLQYGSTFSATHLRLKGNICIPREQFPRLFDDITSKNEPARPPGRSVCGLQFLVSSISLPIFSSLGNLINVVWAH